MGELSARASAMTEWVASAALVELSPTPSASKLADTSPIKGEDR